jgi:hypothetical protein
MKKAGIASWCLAAWACSLRAQNSFEQAWETRSVVGLEQSAASSSNSRLNYLFDFYTSRALGAERNAADANWLVWGNVRLATIPIQISSTSGLLVNPVSGIVNLKSNQLVQSAEFQTGLEWRPGKFIWKNTALNRARTLGIIVGVGASGPFHPKESVMLFKTPPQIAQLFQTFSTALTAEGFTPANPPQYLAFTTPDRDQFYRQWLAGFRISTFATNYPANPPATYAVTVGQDEVVTGGALRGAVARFDVFYPLPVNMGGLNLIYLFGTATMQLRSSAMGTTPLFLDPAAAGVTATSPGTAILVCRNKRDYYRVGVGVDLLNALRQLKIGGSKPGS